MRKAIKFLKKNSTLFNKYKVKPAQCVVVPDPQHADVDLVVSKKWVAIVYHNMQDFEHSDAQEDIDMYKHYLKR